MSHYKVVNVLDFHQISEQSLYCMMEKWECLKSITYFDLGLIALLAYIYPLLLFLLLLLCPLLTICTSYVKILRY